MAERRPLPQDFATLAPTMTWDQMRGHWGVTQRQVQAWLAEARIVTSRPALNTLPVPDDLASIAPMMSMTQLAAHYGRSRDVIARWCREKHISLNPSASVGEALRAFLATQPVSVQQSPRALAIAYYGEGYSAVEYERARYAVRHLSVEDDRKTRTREEHCDMFGGMRRAKVSAAHMQRLRAVAESMQWAQWAPLPSLNLEDAECWA